MLRDGTIAVAIEKERLTREKHDGFNDSEAIQYCFAAEHIQSSDLALVVQNANFGMAKFSNRWYHGPRILDSSVPIVTISHHLAHAYSALGPSEFDRAAVLVIDGCGNSFDDCVDRDGAQIMERPPAGIEHLYFEKDSYYLMDGNKVRCVCKDFSPWGMGAKDYPMQPRTTLHSVGGAYLAASMYIFRGFEDPGKLMGLAPYGRLGVYKNSIFDTVAGRIFVKYDWMDTFAEPCRSSETFRQNFHQYADIARWVQDEVERAVLYVAHDRYHRAHCPNLCYAGGVALNAVANRRLLLEGPFKHVFIQPAAGDNGLAVGAAYYGWMEVMGKQRVRHSGSTCFGKKYSAATIDEAIRSYGSRVQSRTPYNYIAEMAESLASGQIVGWFREGSEFGPRALGHRSILADPRRPDVRAHINQNVKNREDFRPFAPSVLADEAQIYFNCQYTSPYMLLVAPVRPEWRGQLPGITHVDGSARIHTVDETADPVYHGLLNEFKKRTGIGILLNTSLNKKGMPIVETPNEAIEMFLNSAIDLLVIEDRFITERVMEKMEMVSATCDLART